MGVHTQGRTHSGECTLRGVHTQVSEHSDEHVLR